VILLDTGVVAALMRRRPDPAVVRWLDRQPSRTVWLPIVVVFELRYSVAIEPDPIRHQRLEAALEILLGQIFQERVAPLDRRAVQHAARLAALRHARGRAVVVRDALLAGIALARGAQLATAHTRNFRDTAIGLIDPFGF
jgi:predicted nucleic acid-binding protein